MTILGAMDCGDCIAIASDSMVFTGPTGTKANMPKLWPIAGLSVVWGYFGAGTVGGDLRAWIDATDLSDIESWIALKDVLSAAMARMTGDLRLRAGAVGADVPPHQLTSALFVGYVRGQGRIVSITPEGASAFAPLPFIFIGTDATHAAALASLETLHRERGDGFALSTNVLRISISVVTDLMFTTGGPVQMWKTTPQGVERLE